MDHTQWPSHHSALALTSRPWLAACRHGTGHDLWLLLKLVVAIPAPFASDGGLHTDTHMTYINDTDCMVSTHTHAQQHVYQRLLV